MKADLNYQSIVQCFSTSTSSSKINLLKDHWSRKTVRLWYLKINFSNKKSFNRKLVTKSRQPTTPQRPRQTPQCTVVLPRHREPRWICEFRRLVQVLTRHKSNPDNNPIGLRLQSITVDRSSRMLSWAINIKTMQVGSDSNIWVVKHHLLTFLEPKWEE